MAGLVNRMGGNKPIEEGGLTVFVMPAEEVEKLAGYELTRGVLCAMRRKPLPSVEETVANARRIAILEDRKTLKTRAAPCAWAPILASWKRGLLPMRCTAKRLSTNAIAIG